MNKEKFSICILTYNSESTVLETLESIRCQTYGSDNIELIISDDFSVDNTVSIVDDWLENNRNEFFSTVFNKNETNLGVSKNINIAWKLTNFNWIKSLAGDDVLYSDALEKFDSFDKLGKQVIFADIAKFKSNPNDCSKVRSDDTFFALTTKEQYISVLKGHLLYAPSVFLRKDALQKINYCDENYFIEDLPLWINLLKNNFVFYKFDHLCVGYRVAESISRSRIRIENEFYFYDKQKIYKHLIYKDLKKYSQMACYDLKTMFFITKFIIKVCDNKKGLLSNILFALSIFFRPYRIYTFICNKYL